MNVARVVALVLFVFGVLFAFGWVVGMSLGHALGCIAAGLALEVLSGVPVVSRTL